MTPLSVVCGFRYTLYLVCNPESNETCLFLKHRDTDPSETFLDIGRKKPVAIFGGWNQSAAIDSDGGIIFIPDPYYKSSKDPNKILDFVRLPDGERAVMVACCDFVCCKVFALSSTGRVFAAQEPAKGNPVYFEEVKELKGIEIASVSGTFNHCLVLSKEGRVFGVGSNYEGQIGLGEEVKDVSTFTEVSSLNEKHIAAVYAGCHHSLFQSSSGKVFACGSNEYGEIPVAGGPSEDIFYEPVETQVQNPSFCISGAHLSAFFYDFIPPNSANRKVTDQKLVFPNKLGLKPPEEKTTQKKLTATNISPQKKSDTDAQSNQRQLESRIAELTEENNRLKKENESLHQKIKKADQSSKGLHFYDSSHFDQLRRIEAIGHGGQSTVYKVSREHYYALKILEVTAKKTKKKSSQQDELFEKIRRFFQEYEIMTILNHPNIIKTFGFSSGDETHPPSILLEFCPLNLSDAVEDLSSFERVTVIFEAALGMSAVHRANLIHRDLKPENILLDDERHVKVSDFGISCIVDVKAQTQTKTSGVGSMKFMAPELINESTHYTEKVDVYSFGVVVFFVLTCGELPELRIIDVANGKKAAIPETVSKFGRELISKCWEFEPSERPSFDEIIEMIKSNNFALVDGIESEVPQIKKFLSIE